MTRFAVALLFVLAACALIPAAPSSGNPRAIMDAYLIAHGMVRSYAERPEADPAVTAQLDRLDERARAEIRSLTRGRGGDAAATARAVSALTDYAARQTTMAR